MGNELKLSLENFQSISHGELIFHTGTNAIIGQSNSGKTATFRALKACLSNPIGSQRFIKKGTNNSSVTLEYNGNQIVWKRTPKESSYTINGEDFLKTGKSNAFKIIEDTGFVIDDNDVIMNIEEELQLPFPFGISKSELFKLYENVFCVSDSAVILKAAKEEEEEVKNRLSILENDVTVNKNKLKELDNFKKEINIEFLKERRNSFKRDLDKINFLSNGLEVIHKAAKIQGFELQELSFDNRLPAFNDLNTLKDKLLKLKQLHILNKELKEVLFMPTVDLASYNILKELAQTCAKLKQVENFKVSEQKFEDKLQHYKELKDYFSSLKLLKEEIKNKKEKLEKTEHFVQSIEEKLKEFKVCPLCHKPLN